MIQDAEKNAEADKEFHELVTLCNEAEHLVHSTRKAVKEAGDKLTEDEKNGLEDNCKALEDAVKEKSKEKIQSCKEELDKSNAQLAQKLYANPNAQGEADQATAGAQTADEKADDNVVDADFKEVDEDK